MKGKTASMKIELNEPWKLSSKDECGRHKIDAQDPAN